jgi:hypothetical protein
MKNLNVVVLNVNVLSGRINIENIVPNIPIKDIDLFPPALQLKIFDIIGKSSLTFTKVAVGIGNNKKYLITTEQLSDLRRDIEIYNAELQKVKSILLSEYDIYIEKMLYPFKEAGLQTDSLSITTKEEIENNFSITVENTDFSVDKDDETIKSAFASKAVDIIKEDIIEKVERSLENRGEISSMLQRGIKHSFNRVKSLNIFDIPELNEMCQSKENFDIDDLDNLIIKCEEFEKKYNLK